MGIKGSKKSGATDEMIQLVMAKLAPLDDVSSKKMFGGYGIFCQGKMFGMVDPKGQVLFKVNDTTDHFEQAGSEKHGRMPYYTVPNKVFEDQDLFLDWAKKSIG